MYVCSHYQVSLHGHCDVWHMAVKMHWKKFKTKNGDCVHLCSVCWHAVRTNFAGSLRPSRFYCFRAMTLMQFCVTGRISFGEQLSYSYLSVAQRCLCPTSWLIVTGNACSRHLAQALSTCQFLTFIRLNFQLHMSPLFLSVLLLSELLAPGQVPSHPHESTCVPTTQTECIM